PQSRPAWMGPCDFVRCRERNLDGRVVELARAKVSSQARWRNALFWKSAIRCRPPCGEPSSADLPAFAESSGEARRSVLRTRRRQVRYAASLKARTTSKRSGRGLHAPVGLRRLDFGLRRLERRLPICLAGTARQRGSHDTATDELKSRERFDWRGSRY